MYSDYKKRYKTKDQFPLEFYVNGIKEFFNTHDLKDIFERDTSFYDVIYIEENTCCERVVQPLFKLNYTKNTLRLSLVSHIIKNRHDVASSLHNIETLCISTNKMDDEKTQTSDLVAWNKQSKRLHIDENVICRFTPVSCNPPLNPCRLCSCASNRKLKKRQRSNTTEQGSNQSKKTFKISCKGADSIPDQYEFNVRYSSQTKQIVSRAKIAVHKKI
jgi:hypothetical protein